MIFGHSFGAMVPLETPRALPIVGDLLRHTVSPLVGRLMWPAMLKLLFSPAAVPRYFEQFPVVIVAGAQDRYVDHRRHSVALHALLPGSELVLSPRAGHMVHHVDPRRVLHAIEAAAR